MKKKWIIISTFILTIGIIMTIIFFYIENNPLISFETKLTSVDDETYDSIGGLDTVRYPEKENFKRLESTIKVTYSENIEEIEVYIPKTYKELLGNDIYWSGNTWEQADPNKNEIEYHYELILYTGETSEEELKNLLKEGKISITWKVNGEKKSKVYSIIENAVF